MGTNSNVASGEFTELTHFVHVTGVLRNKFVEFDYSIGTPTLYVELVLPFKQFRQFCIKHDVKELTTEQQHQVELDKLKWRHGQLD
jgi:phenol hydroxylase P0 protein|tara:strand:+ start:11247 stop:11504 length:258 start_codon:yes stop_codon:yes gene_type:complete